MQLIVHYEHELYPSTRDHNVINFSNKDTFFGMRSSRRTCSLRDSSAFRSHTI